MSGYAASAADPSAFANWRPQPIDLLGPIQAGQQMRSNQIANTQAMATQQAGRDYAASIGPDGNVNDAQFASRIHNDPTAAPAAISATNDALTNATAAYKLHINQMQTLGQLAYNLGATGADASTVHQHIADYVANGVLTASEGAQAVTQLASDAPTMHKQLLQLGTQLLSQADQHSQIIGSQQLIDNGSNLIPARTPMLGSPYQDGPAIGKGLSPSEASPPTTINTPGGSVTEPLGAYAAANGTSQTSGGGLLMPTMPTGPFSNQGGLPTGAQAQQPSGQINGPGMVPNLPVGNVVGSGQNSAPQPTSKQPTVPQSLGTPTTPNGNPNWNGIEFPAWARPPQPGQPIFTPTGLAAQQTASSAQFNALRNDVGNLAQQKTLLQNILSERLDANPGQLANAQAAFGSVAQQLGLATGDQATDYQLLSKNVSQLVQASATKLGVPTDSKMDEVVAGTPNGKMTPDGIKGAAGIVIGQLDYKQAELKAWTNYQNAAQAAGLPISTGAFGDFNQKFQDQTSPAVFQWPYLSPKQRTAYTNSLNGDDKTKLLSQLKWAVNAGLTTYDQFQGK